MTKHTIDSLYKDAMGGGERMGPGRSTNASAASAADTFDNPYWTATRDNLAKNWQNDPREKYFQGNYHPPYPGAPHDGGPEDLANTQALTDAMGKANNYAYAVNNKSTWLDQLALMMGVGTVTAGFGAVAAPAIAEAVGTTAAGAATGAVGGLASSGLSGGNVLKKVGTGALLGGIGGAASDFSSASTQQLIDQGIPPDIAKAIVSAGVGAGKGAIGGEISGQGAGAGAASGAASAGTNWAGNTIFNSGSTIFNSGNTVYGSNNPDAPSSTSSNSNMSYDPTSGYDPNAPWQPYDPTNPGGTGGGSTDVSQTPGPYDPGNITFQDPNGPGGASSPTSGWLPTDQYGNVMSGGGGGSSAGGNAIGSILSRLLGIGGGSNGGGGGANGALLQRLFGYGASGAGGYLQHQAAVNAAAKYGQQSKFNPFSINGPGGSTSFSGNTANGTLNPAQQTNENDLNKLVQGNATSLAGGNDAQVNGIFNNLQKSQRDSNNRMFQSNLDSQFGNGVLASTAGQYQTQAALDAINKQTTNNHITAQGLGTQIQQNQLAGLTAGLNGNNQIQQQQLDQMKLGGNLGQEQSYANSQAYKPSVNANTTSPWGDLLSNMGGNSLNSGNNDQLIQYLRQLMGG